MEYEKIIISEDQIKATVSRMAEQVNCAYKGVEKLLIVVLLEGARPFSKDLVRQLDMP